ncbi:MAG: NAD+ synthetase [Candidatus Midichloriaceae bacterium]|jgi:NAD+ synthetase
MKISLCQINPILGDINYNLNKIIAFYEKEKSKSDLIVFPELSLTGYPLKDLVKNQSLISKTENALSKLTNYVKTTPLILGTPIKKPTGIFNAAVLINNGIIENTIYKHNLPNYSVFNESRNFTAYKNYSRSITINGTKIAILICEDAWHDEAINFYHEDKPDFFLILNASPYEIGKLESRYSVTKRFSEKYNTPIGYLNLVGGQDDLVFDGRSFILNGNGDCIALAKRCSEDIINIDTKNINKSAISDFENKDEELYEILLLALKDYVRKNGFEKIILGLSGGIDSAFIAVLAADALGANNVKCVMLPSRYNSKKSLEYANKLIANIQCIHELIDIDKLYENFLSIFDEMYNTSSLKDVTSQNLQARIRSVILMGVSNQENSLLISTSNKSESAVGYTTLYGDMSGAFAPIKDVYKTQIYELCNWRNKNIPKNTSITSLNVIPIEIINREPSAELSYNQKDSDKLPEYKILDEILFHLIENEISMYEIAKKTDSDIETIKMISGMIKLSEFKRNQAPIGPKISSKSFNNDRIYPITYK